MLAEDIGWPREKTQNGARIVYYQPQIDSWKDYRMLDAADPSEFGETPAYAVKR